MKDFFIKYKVIIISAILILLFLALSLMIDSNSGQAKMKDNLKDWQVDTKKDDYVVTVIGQTTCGHCISYKPVMQNVLNKYDFNVYWFEVDTFSDEDYNTLIETYELTNYKGTPYTFITKNDEFVDFISGGTDEESLVSFLKENNVIK